MTATDTESALLAAVRANPGEDAPRLVYADWLEENAGTVACGACKGEGKIGVGNNGNPYMAKCDECNGSACVSDGRAELAEFVRVQVELAVEHSDCGTKGYGPCGKRCEELRTRERELAVEIDSAFGELPLYWTTDQIPLAKGIIVRRGLPAVVRCTLAEWMGGECQNCGGFGEFRRRYDNGDGPEGPCPDCGGKWNSGPFDDRDDYWDRGTGRTPGIGPRLAQRWPVVAVEVADVSPMNFSFGSMFARGSDESSLPDWLPDEIHAKFPTGKTWHTNNVDAIRNVRIFKDESAARAALSDALIAWARGQEMEEKR